MGPLLSEIQSTLEVSESSEHVLFFPNVHSLGAVLCTSDLIFRSQYLLAPISVLIHPPANVLKSCFVIRTGKWDISLKNNGTFLMFFLSK